MARRQLRPLFITTLALLPLACGLIGTPPPSPPPSTNEQAVEADRPTVEEAREFVAEVEEGLRRIWEGRARAAWVNQTFINDDTEALVAASQEATAEYIRQMIERSTRFSELDLPEDLARKLHLLKLAQTVPAPSDPEKRSELARIQAWMTGAYGKGQYCPEKGSRLARFTQGDSCLNLDELSKILRTSKRPDELLEAWTGWHAVGKEIRDPYTRYVELANEGAQAIGFDDMGALWRSGYDMSPEAFEADIDRVWSSVKPLYEKLHCYVRARLRQAYGANTIPEKGPIPAHLLGNMWAQDWSHIYDLVAPYPREAKLDVSRTLERGKWTADRMVKLGEQFFVSLGLDPLPKGFWERSQFTRPSGRDVVCHASAWDIAGDLRIKMCIQPTEEDLITIHHELGHIYYFQRYANLPILFQSSANDGFHEGIGDTIALSITPNYLKEVGLIGNVPRNDRAALNQQMKTALEKIAFLPFGLIIDKWRWDVLSGKTPKEEYNSAFWDLRVGYQGIGAPVERSEDDFDPGAKYHIPASTPYARYFLAHIYQFQFHRALCRASGYTGPLPECSIYGNKEAGERLKAMLDLGASRPWQEAIRVLGGETYADASALLEYFAPLHGYLEDATRNESCGW